MAVLLLVQKTGTLLNTVGATGTYVFSLTVYTADSLLAQDTPIQLKLGAHDTPLIR